MDKKHYAVIEKYTLPFVQLVFEKGQQQDVFEKLSQIRAVFEETNLADFLSHIGVDEGEKEKAFRLFQNSDSQLIDNFIEVVILNHRADLFYDMLVEIQHQIEKQSNEFEVTVKSVQALTDSQKDRLKPMIEQKMGLKVRSLKQELDDSLIGGFVISANNKTIDASIKRQLQLVKENLK
ncbi:F0F1 ATP synthase subunit delta [Streptococcus sp. Marseille-P7375]|uniref:F0F1 ATP synthase subunit delta n=1 Tax=Streptococcus sp. Marseille-P7375 TaxID=2487318 RepID=UPI0011E663BA|nr:F0F1 ATP synthase subunit delta [Streptococcus sp. Marseille-P7375]